MRNFKNVSLIRQKMLAEVFPEMLSFYSCVDVDGYKKASVSVFDHWLSQGEAIENIDNVSVIQANKNNEFLHKFAILLAQSTDAYMVKFRGKYSDKRVTYREFTSQHGVVNSLIPKHHFAGGRSRFILALPQINSVYFEGCDFTHQVYYKTEKDLEFVTQLAKQSGLSIVQ